MSEMLQNNVDQQESLESTETKAVDVIASADKASVDNAVKSSSLSGVSTESFETSLNAKNVQSFLETTNELKFWTIDASNSKISLDAAFSAVMKNAFPNAKSIEMKDIYALSDTQKADLAWKIVAIQPLSADQKDKQILSSSGEIVKLSSIETALLYGLPIWKETKLPQWDSYAPRWVQLDMSPYSVSRADFELYSKVVAEYKNDAFKKVFVSFYKPHDAMPSIVPTTYALATWDLRTSTTGIWGVWNLWRESFIYDFGSKNTQVNSVRFWPVKNSINISVWAEWIDKAWWEIAFALTSPDGKEYTITWTYTSEWLVLQKDLSLAWVTVNGAMITIPEAYKNWDIKVQTKSNQYDNWTYDEIVFPISTDGIIAKQPADAADTYQMNNEVNYKLGEYKLTDKQLMSIKNSIVDIGDYGRRILSDTLPITLYAWVNDVSIPDSKIGPAFLQNKELFSDDNYSVIKHDIKNNSIKTIRTEYQNKIDGMTAVEMGNSAWSGDQLKAQKLLTKLRMLTVLEQMDNNPRVTALINQNKLTITSDYKNEKTSWIDIKPFTYVEKK